MTMIEKRCKICSAKRFGPSMRFPNMPHDVFICGDCVAHWRSIFGQTIKVEQVQPRSSTVAMRYDSNIPYMLPGESMDDTRKRLGEFIPKPKRR